MSQIIDIMNQIGKSKMKAALGWLNVSVVITK